MKSPQLFLGCFLALFALSLSAQTTGFNYQAVLRNNNFAPIANQAGTATVSILNSVGTELYRETHNITTDQLGLFNLVIGKGNNPVGNFAGVDWGSGGRFVKIVVNANGNNYDFFPSELQAVPYAKVAEKALQGDGDAQTLSLSGQNLSISNGNTIALPTGTDAQTLSVSGQNLSISNGNSVTLPAEVDGSVTNEIQTISLSGNQISLSNGGGSVTLPVGTDAQTLSVSGQNLSISNGNTVALPAEIDGSVTNEIQALSLSGNQISLSNGGGSVTLPAEVDGSVTNEIQTLSLNGQQLSLSNGGGAVMLPTSPDAQTLTLNGQNLSISNGNSVALPAEVDGSVTNEIQALSLSGQQLSLSNGGGSVTLPASPDAQTLTLNGQNLSISNGNTVALPASGWTDGNALTTTVLSKRLGIGTATPQQKVHIHDQDQSFAWLQMTNGSNGSGASDGAFIGTVNKDLQFQNCEAGDITFGSCANIKQLVIKNDGNTGIGMPAPVAKLDVLGSSASNQPAIIGAANYVDPYTPQTGILGKYNGGGYGAGVVGLGFGGVAPQDAGLPGDTHIGVYGSSASGPYYHAGYFRGRVTAIAQPDGSAAEFYNINPTNNVAVAYVLNDGNNNNTLYVKSASTTNTKPALYVENQSNASEIGAIEGRMTSTAPGTLSAGVKGVSEGVNSGCGVIGIQKGFSYGVYGYASDGIGIAGLTNNGFAGYFFGRTHINGTLSKNGGSFKIDHPQDPANKYLQHSFVESPDMMNVYNGNIVTDAQGNAVVELPPYFETLNRDFRYQLTCIGQFAQVIVSEKIRNNSFSIKTDKPNVEVSWQVTGIRHDPWAEANRIVPELEKADNEKGKYLNPEVYGKPRELLMHAQPMLGNDIPQHK